LLSVMVGIIFESAKVEDVGNAYLKDLDHAKG
jgi:hypothetical protein